MPNTVSRRFVIGLLVDTNLTVAFFVNNQKKENVIILSVYTLDKCFFLEVLLSGTMVFLICFAVVF